jgi:hypothetical protein
VTTESSAWLCIALHAFNGFNVGLSCNSRFLLRSAKEICFLRLFIIIVSNSHSVCNIRAHDEQLKKRLTDVFVGDRSVHSVRS